MPTDIETEALNLLQHGQTHEAVQALHRVINRNPALHWDLARILNLIEPCGMIEAAKDGLRRRINQRFVEQCEYQMHKPMDEDIGRVVTA